VIAITLVRDGAHTMHPFRAHFEVRRRTEAYQRDVVRSIDLCRVGNADNICWEIQRSSQVILCNSLNSRIGHWLAFIWLA